MKYRRLKVLIVALAAILVTYLTQPTLAYYSTVGRATNVVTSGKISFMIHEYTADGSRFPEGGVYVIPGDVVGKKVTIENVCSHPFYLRVKLVHGVNDDVLSAEDCLKVDLNTEDWIAQEDGYLYYRHVVQPQEMTRPVFTQVEIVGDRVDQNYLGKTLSLSVMANAVQSENNPANVPWEAAGWPAE
jgi:hypothetical protein